MKKMFTSEFVTPGHPDKICDIISDTILDDCLLNNNNCRTAVETMVTQNNVIIAGEISNVSEEIPVSDIVNEVCSDIGYNYNDMKFKSGKLNIINLLTKQSIDIKNAVEKNNKELGAGDQGIMFGAATSKYDRLTLMPIEWRIAKDLSDRLYELHYQNPSIIRPDGKTQVTTHINDYGNLVIDTIVVSVNHSPETKKFTMLDIDNMIFYDVIMKILDEKYYWIDHKFTNILINPSGSFIIGGPDGDTGLTGRKIVVDGYGGAFPVGGGAFSGKDPSKVDRSGALAARWIAYNIVSSGLCETAEVQLSYAIGKPEPTSLNINLTNINNEVKGFTHKSTDEFISKLSDKIIDEFRLTPSSIIDRFKLTTDVSYSKLAKHGHFGSNSKNKYEWEKECNEFLDIIYRL